MILLKMVSRREMLFLPWISVVSLFCPQLRAQTGPSIALLTGGGDWYADTVRVYGFISGAVASSATIEVRNGTFTRDTSVSVVSGLFSSLIPLADGTDTITTGFIRGADTITSNSAIFNYHADHSTDIVINTGISAGSVTLDASASSNHDNLPVTYNWTADTSNPSIVALSGENTAVLGFNSPSKDGEYYFTVTAKTALDTSWARTVIVVDSGKVHTVDPGVWHPSWVDSAVVYEIFVHSFTFGGQFIEVTAAIPQLKALGINCIWLMPIMPSVSTHGYNITDYYDVSPGYGSKKDFTDLVNTAHRYGVKIILDLVINHTSAAHPFIEDSYKYGVYSPYHDFYEWHNGIVSDSTYVYYDGWSDLANINYQSDWTRNYLLQMAKYWVEKFNIDGYRCDVAWGVNDGGVDEWGETEPRPGGAAFWQTFRAELKAVKPDIYLLGEMDASHYYAPSLYFYKKFDSGYDWPFLNSVENCLDRTSTVSGLDALVRFYQGSNYPSYARPLRFIENHDLPRFISMYSVPQTKMAATLFLTLPGIPLVYAGQEYGEMTMRDLINRTDPNSLYPFYLDLIHLRTSHPALQQGIVLRLQTSSSDSVYAYLRKTDSDRVVVLNNFYGSILHPTVEIPQDSVGLDSTKTWFVNDQLNRGSVPASVTSSGVQFEIDLAPYQSRILTFSDSPSFDAIDDKSLVPGIFDLKQNYPNPFNPSTTISYQLPANSYVSLKVYDIIGREVAMLFDGRQNAGTHEVKFDGSRMASGMYFVKMNSGTFSATKKIMLIK